MVGYVSRSNVLSMHFIGTQNAHCDTTLASKWLCDRDVDLFSLSQTYSVKLCEALVFFSFLGVVTEQPGVGRGCA